MSAQAADLSRRAPQRSSGANAPAPAVRAESIAYGPVQLRVTDVGRSLAFWRDLIGLLELPPDGEGTRLGVDGRALVVLHPDAVRPAGGRCAGLYHLAIHLPDAVEFARVLARLADRRLAHSPTDHIFSKATYLRDPDGIMLELTLETPERCRSLEITRQAVVLLDSEGRRRGPTEPLDLAAALAPLGGAADIELGLPAGAYVGHVHLHVPELRAAHRFYRDVIGFQEHAYMTPVGMADLYAGGRFPHRLAINDWQGPLARQAPAGTAGMRSYELLLQGPDRLDALAARAQAAGVALSRTPAGALSLRDPAANEITIREAFA